jgi:hypothetical protein
MSPIPRLGCCDRCPAPPGGTVGLLADGDPGAILAARVARRRLFKAAVFQQADGDGQAVTAASVPADPAGPPDVRSGFPDASELPRAVTGTLIDVSPQVLVVGDTEETQRFTLTADATAWRGATIEPAALRQGDHVVVRLLPGGRRVADRIWANIGRVTGVIAEHSGTRLVVDEGSTRPHQVVVIKPHSASRIMVRFPTLRPGYLVDIIGMRHGTELEALIPATSQPSYVASRPPALPLISGHVPDEISGSATWHEPRGEPAGVLGVSYPALDPETGCLEDAAAPGQRYGRMPYLAVGSTLLVRNECNGAAALLPVTGCAAMARLFNDRCVTCGTSPRGRVADLTLASFVALGGELDRSCFNATITIGG